MRIEIALNLSAVDSLLLCRKSEAPTRPAEMGSEVEIVNKRADKAPKSTAKVRSSYPLREEVFDFMTSFIC